MGFLAPIGAAIVEALPAAGGALTAAEGAGALGTGVTAAGLGSGAIGTGMTAAELGAGSYAALPAGASMAGDLLANLGLSTPGSTVSSLNSGLDTMLKIKSLNQRNQHPIYPIGPNIHSGNAVPVSLGKPLARKRSPLEEFALLLGRQ